MYKKASGSIVVFLILYVYDILLVGNDIPPLLNVKQWLGNCFSMKDLGEAETILSIKIYRDRSKRLLGLSQEKVHRQSTETVQYDGLQERFHTFSTGSSSK